jgi:hypothetical protein
MLKFSKNHFLKKKCFVKENENPLGIFQNGKVLLGGSFHMKVEDGLTTLALWVQIYGPNIQGAPQLETSNLHEVLGLYTMDYITKARLPNSN